MDSEAGSPEPTYRPTVVRRTPGAIPAEQAQPKLWGDDVSGYASDLIFVSDDEIQELIIELPAGGRFQHSPQNRTIMAADQLYFVLSGSVALADPSTGEVQLVNPGQAVHIPPGTWHHGFNRGGGDVRILEFFAPPPATGSSQPYGRSQPYLSEVSYADDSHLGSWPPPAASAPAGTMRVIRDADYFWRMEGLPHPFLVGILVSTPQLTVAVGQLNPGQRTGPVVRGGAEAGYVLEGKLNLLIQDDDGTRTWHQVKAGDGFYVPPRTRHSFHNLPGHPVQFLFGVAPSYVAPTE